MSLSGVALLFTKKNLDEIFSSLPNMGFERTTKYALSAPQKVGRTTENILLSLYHMDILTPRGYETH